MLHSSYVRDLRRAGWWAAGIIAVALVTAFLAGQVQSQEFPTNATARRYVLLTKADADVASGPCTALLVGTAGTANLQGFDGVTRTDVPLQQGYNPLYVKQLRTGGTADNIWCLYGQ